MRLAIAGQVPLMLSVVDPFTGVCTQGHLAVDDIFLSLRGDHGQLGDHGLGVSFLASLGGYLLQWGRSLCHRLPLRHLVARAFEATSRKLNFLVVYNPWELGLIRLGHQHSLTEID